MANSVEEVINLFPNKDQMERLIAAIAGQGSAPQLDATYAAMMDGTNTTKIFRSWWPLSAGDTITKYERLCRFGRMLAASASDRKYTLRYYKDTVSSSPVMMAWTTRSSSSPRNMETTAGGASFAPRRWSLPALATAMRSRS